MQPQIDDLSFLQRGRLLWSLMRDDRVSPWIKRVGPAAILAYVISPIDLIPDLLLGAGQIDDVGVIAVGLILLLRLLVRFAPDAVVSEHMARITGRDWQDGGRLTVDELTVETTGRVREPGWRSTSQR